MPAPRSIGLLVTAPPGTDAFAHFIDSASRPPPKTVVYGYLLHDAVAGAAQVVALPKNDLKLHACAFAAEQRSVILPKKILPAGLGTLAQMLQFTGEFRLYSQKSESVFLALEKHTPAIWVHLAADPQVNPDALESLRMAAGLAQLSDLPITLVATASRLPHAGKAATYLKLFRDAGGRIRQRANPRSNPGIHLKI